MCAVPEIQMAPILMICLEGRSMHCTRRLERTDHIAIMNGWMQVVYNNGRKMRKIGGQIMALTDRKRKRNRTLLWQYLMRILLKRKEETRMTHLAYWQQTNARKPAYLSGSTLYLHLWLGYGSQSLDSLHHCFKRLTNNSLPWGVLYYRWLED